VIVDSNQEKDYVQLYLFLGMTPMGFCVGVARGYYWINLKEVVKMLTGKQKEILGYYNRAHSSP